MFPCTVLENILEISIESCKLSFTTSKKIQLEPWLWSNDTCAAKELKEVTLVSDDT